MWTAFVVKNGAIINETVNVDRNELFEFYVNVINEEIKTEITEQSQLNDKLDWFENEYDMRFKDQCIVFNKAQNKYELNVDYSKLVFSYDIEQNMNMSLLMKLVHTRIDSAQNRRICKLYISKV